MTELMAGPLGLIVVAAVMWWGITFNRRLKERYHCTACTFWGVIGGIVGSLECFAGYWFLGTVCPGNPSSPPWLPA